MQKIRMCGEKDNTITLIPGRLNQILPSLVTGICQPQFGF